MKYKVNVVGDPNDYGCVFETDDYWDAVIWCDSILYATCHYDIMAELNRLQIAFNRNKNSPQIMEKQQFPYEVINLCISKYNLEIEEVND